MSIRSTFTPFPSSNPQWKYDVFLSFRGDDTRKGFTDHLYTALEDKGIITFRDDLELGKGIAISPELSTAIEESRFALIIISQNYGSSTWCLDELQKILECMEAKEAVLPIFYHVDPSDVRKQTGPFAEAFIKHEKRFRDEKKKVQRWRDALTRVANISGWNSKESYESQLVKDIAEVIWTKLRSTECHSVENLVGIDSRLKQINSLLGRCVDDVRFIGIWGMSGIGKTTIARVVYERISREFEFSMFIDNVRNVVERGGLVSLQRQLLSGIYMKNDISNLHEGTTMIRRFFCHKKVLLVLDNVNHLDQLQYLVGNKTWFGCGSRVLITTIDEDILLKHGVERRIKVKGLNSDDALQLFSQKAFGKDYPEPYYVVLSNRVVNHVKCPLALEVLGSFLRGKGTSKWKSVLDKLGKVCSVEILKTLEISYHGLTDDEKKMFLDIACFFNGKDKDQVIASCDVSEVIGIEVLIARSLLTILNGKLYMHDALQEMGREIVIRESPFEPGRRSRLWLREDANHVLSKNTETEAIEGIVLHPAETGLKVHANAKSFSMMKNLRFLKIDNVNLPNGLEHLPDSIQILKWTGYPSTSLPSSFNPEKLLELSMRHSCIYHFRTGIKPLYNLKILNLSHSLNLLSMPNFRAMPYLEVLILEGCTRLFEVDPSIEALERLVLMNLKDCRNLVHFPGSIYGLKSLKVLNLFGCLQLNKLPEELGAVECLEELHMSGTAIRELPSSIGMLEGLTLLNLRDCKELVSLPTSLSGVKSLKVLNLSGCSKLEKLPEELGHAESLERLDMSGTAIREPPSSLSLLRNLKVLSLQGCKCSTTFFY
ncbi:disease resistance protein RUN1-like [Rosa sericea]